MKRALSLVLAICILLYAGSASAQTQVIIKGEDEDEFKHPVKTDTKGRVQGVQAQNLLDACDVKTGWAALSNDTTGIDVDLDHVEGAASLEFDKVDGTDNSVLGGCEKTLSSAVDIAHYMENNGFILVSMNVSATTDIAYCFIRLGTDASNYNEWRVDDDALSAGWQQVRFPFYAPSTAGNLGNGISATSVSYVAVGCEFDLETSTLADLRFDNIAVNTGFQTSADLQSQVATAAATPNINVVKIASQPVDMNVGTAGAGTQRFTQATDDIVSVSDDDNANTIANPLYMQISQDGTNAMATAYPLPVSATVAANTLANPLFFQISQDGTIAVDATHPLPISKDMAANATGNRIWVKSDTDMVAGTATNVNGGNRDAGTATVAIADDDPVAVSTAYLNKWDDGADRAKVNVEHDTILDDLDATTGWTVGNDATANIALSANHVRGTGSLTFDKVNGTNFTEAYIQKTITSLAIDDYEIHNLIEWALYVSSLSDVAYVFVRLGTDSSNYSEWRVDDDDLTAGAWNPIAMFAGNAEYAVVGTGLNSAAITYIAMGASFDLEDDLLAGIGVDDFMIHETSHTTSSISAEVATTVSTANINLQKVGNKIVDKDIGVSGNGTQRVVNATDDPNLSKLTVEDLDTTGATDDKQVVGIVTQSATGAVLNSAAAPLFTSGVSTGGTSSMTATGPTVVNPGPVLVLAAQDISQAASWGFVVFNNGGGGNPLTDADVQVSRDGGVTYYSLTWTECDNLADTADCDYDFPLNSYTHMLVYTTSAVGTSVTVQFSALAR